MEDLGQDNPALIRDKENYASDKPALTHTKDLPYASEFMSIEEELVAQASQAHTLYCKDNLDVYFLLEESTRGMQYAASIKPFQQVKNDRGAVKLIKEPFAGTNERQAELAQMDKFLHLVEWKVQLFWFIRQHR
eukprot:15363540-Ditylum_brightwellii.AAC.1